MSISIFNFLFTDFYLFFKVRSLYIGNGNKFGRSNKLKKEKKGYLNKIATNLQKKSLRAAKSAVTVQD